MPFAGRCLIPKFGCAMRTGPSLLKIRLAVSPVIISNRYCLTAHKQVLLSDCVLNQIHFVRRLSELNGKQKRQKMLLTATYFSFLIGGVLISAIIYREVDQVRLRIKGFSMMYEKLYNRSKAYIYKDVLLPGFAVKHWEDVQNFEVRSGDIWLVSFPRSGSSWVEKMVCGIIDEKVLCTTKSEPFACLEFVNPGPKSIASAKSPRLIKTFLPLELLPPDIEEKKPKIIYVARNPRDVLVSYYHFMNHLKPLTRRSVEFPEFCNLFINNKVPYSPWWRHVLQFWDKRNEANILFIMYEDLHNDFEGSLRKIADFLGKTLTDAQVQKFVKDCSFDEMKRDPPVNPWFANVGHKEESQMLRKGRVGDWKTLLTAEYEGQLTKRLAYYLRDSDILFQYGSPDSAESMQDLNS